LWILVAAACAVQACEIPRRGIDPDELEHLHAAWCVAHGQVPYRDFFEHHGPALYYLLIPLFKLGIPDLSVLWVGRLAMWCCGVATLGLTGELARRWAGRRTELYAMFLLAWSSIFHGKGIELRPDVPAMLLLMLAVVPFTYATGGGSWRRFLSVGFLAGLAMLFTQKSVVPAAAFAVAACLARILTRTDHSESVGMIVARVSVPIGAGIAAVWGAAGLSFSLAGAAGEFWYSTWYQLWIWPVRSGRWEYLRPTLVSDLTIWTAGIIEISALLKNFRAPETWKEQRGVAALIAAVCIASLAFVKAAYPQYYLLWIPLLAALAARRIAVFLEHLVERRAVLTVIFISESLIILQFLLWRRAYAAGLAGALPRLAEWDPSNTVAMLVLGVALLAGAACARRQKWEAAGLLLVVLGMAYGVLRDVDRALWSNREQVAAIETVNRDVPTDGRVLDGFTGYAALRPHVWYYWWINDYSLALVPDDERDSGLLDLLERTPPAAVLYDSHLQLLPPRVRNWIELHYQPSDLPVLWLPRRPQDRP
jgi:hypothetical protein